MIMMLRVPPNVCYIDLDRQEERGVSSRTDTQPNRLLRQIGPASSRVYVYARACGSKMKFNHSRGEGDTEAF